MEKKSRNNIIENIQIPDGVEVKIDRGIVSVKGSGGECKKNMDYKKVKLELDNKSVMIKAPKATKREKKIVGTLKSHIKNMIKSASEGSIYTLKVCSGHFPMNISVDKREISIKNFFGEKIPRKIKIKEGIDVKVEGDIITVKASNKELAGQFAASIEKLTRRTNYDTRIFQDGCWIINKDGKELK